MKYFEARLWHFKKDHPYDSLGAQYNSVSQSLHYCSTMSMWGKLLTKQRWTKPEGKSILCRLRNVESFTNTAAQLLHIDTAKPFHSQVYGTLTKQIYNYILSCMNMKDIILSLGFTGFIVKTNKPKRNNTSKLYISLKATTNKAHYKTL